MRIDLLVADRGRNLCGGKLIGLAGLFLLVFLLLGNLFTEYHNNDRGIRDVAVAILSWGLLILLFPLALVLDVCDEIAKREKHELQK